MIKREAKFQTLFRHWLRANPRFTAAFELKQTRTDSIPFNAVEEHQIDALLAVRNKSLLYKIPDDSRGVKPFDMVYLKDAHGMIVIKYPHFFVIIDVFQFVKERDLSLRKSLTEDRARAIALEVVEL